MKNENLSNMSIKIAGHLLLWYSVCVVVYCSWAYITRGEHGVRGRGEVGKVLQPKPHLKTVDDTISNTAHRGYSENEYLDSPPQPEVYEQIDLEWGCSEEDLQELFSVIRKNIPDRKTQAWCAAVTYVESRGRSRIIGDKASSGSYGGWQINKKYHPEIINDMGKDWDDYEMNLIGFLSVIQKQAQWREGRDDYHGMASYYNAGGSWATDGKVYADLVMSAMSSILAS